MRRHLIIAPMFALVMLWSSVGSATDFELGGSLSFDKRFLAERDDIPMVEMYNRLLVGMTAYPADEIKVKADLALDYYDLNDAASSKGLGLTSDVAPLDLFLMEAYIQVYDLWVDSFEMTFGIQRIAWGKSFKMGPTDNVNPDDFSDPLNFGEKRPSPAMKLQYTFPFDMTVEYVFLPALRPIIAPRFASLPIEEAFLPIDDLKAQLPESYQGMMDDFDMANTEDMLAPPPFDLSHAMHGARIAWTMFTVNLELSYLYGYDDIPVPVRIDTVMDGMTPSSSTALAAYPSQHVFGGSFAFELWTIGFRGEAAVFLPEETTMAIHAWSPTGQSLDAILPAEMQSLVILEHEPYVKYAFGLEYKTTFGLLIQPMYIHGFVHERGTGLMDYFMVVLEKTFMNGSLKLGATGGFETDGFEDLENHYGVFGNFTMTYKPFQNFEMALGYMLVMGEGSSLFAAMDDYDQVIVKVKASF